ncbi:uncharacterized protein RAG0_15002 [Rhynchosporium agropyri]|uniref:Uncharacterized protein n=1 Tax=Rhynchosporium agropyri TaxID=914238 RepID=A0A1E1LJC2_9HELO|nr:uncharacterized protein RAG0_15002 [Rhynchosporium agropyri]
MKILPLTTTILLYSLNSIKAQEKVEEEVEKRKYFNRLEEYIAVQTNTSASASSIAYYLSDLKYLNDISS